MVMNDISAKITQKHKINGKFSKPCGSGLYEIKKKWSIPFAGEQEIIKCEYTVIEEEEV